MAPGPGGRAKWVGFLFGGLADWLMIGLLTSRWLLKVDILQSSDSLFGGAESGC